MFKGRKRTIDSIAVALRNWHDYRHMRLNRHCEASLREYLQKADVDPDIGVFTLAMDGNISIDNGKVYFQKIRPFFREDA